MLRMSVKRPLQWQQHFSVAVIRVLLRHLRPTLLMRWTAVHIVCPQLTIMQQVRHLAIPVTQRARWSRLRLFPVHQKQIRLQPLLTLCKNQRTNLCHYLQLKHTRLLVRRQSQLANIFQIQRQLRRTSPRLHPVVNRACRQMRLRNLCFVSSARKSSTTAWGLFVLSDELWS